MNTQDLTDIVVDGIDTKDYPDFCDAYIASAYNKKLNRELTESELDTLNQNSEFVYESVLKQLF